MPVQFIYCLPMCRVSSTTYRHK